MVVDERGVFRDDNFQAAVAALQESSAAAATKAGGKGKDKTQAKQVRAAGRGAAAPARTPMQAHRAAITESYCTQAVCGGLSALP